MKTYNILTLLGESDNNLFKKYSKENTKCFLENLKGEEANSSIEIYGVIFSQKSRTDLS